MSMKQEYEIGSEARNLYVVGKMNLWDYQDREWKIKRCGN